MSVLLTMYVISQKAGNEGEGHGSAASEYMLIGERLDPLYSMFPEHCQMSTSPQKEGARIELRAMIKIRGLQEMQLQAGEL